jgi:hypothetical protein
MDRLTALNVFRHVVEVGSFAGAARHLGLSPAAVSKNISELEAALGARLLNRWRLPLPVSTVSNRRPSPPSLSAHLDRGGTLRVNERWVVEGLVDGTIVWTDVRSLRSYAFSPWGQALGYKLTTASGVDGRWLGDRYPGDSHRQALLVLADLIARDMVMVHRSDLPST